MYAYIYIYIYIYPGGDGPEPDGGAAAVYHMYSCMYVRMYVCIYIHTYTYIQGVTGLSQMEALRLFEKTLKEGSVASRPLRVKSVVVRGCPFGKKGKEKTVTPYLRISTMAGVLCLYLYVCM